MKVFNVVSKLFPCALWFPDDNLSFYCLMEDKGEAIDLRVIRSNVKLT